MRSHKTATVLLSLFLATTAYADDEVSKIDVCRDFSIIAKEIMTARQKKRPMSESLPIAIDRIEDWAEEYEFDAEKAEEMAAALVMAAYKSTSYDVEELRRDEIGEFENLHFEECYKGLTSD